MESLNTIENSADTMASAKIETIRIRLAPGSAIHKVSSAAILMTAKKAIQGFRGPVWSAMEPRMGDRTAMTSPAAAMPNVQTAWPCAGSSASRETKYGPNMNVVTMVKKGWAAQSNSIQPRIPCREVFFGASGTTVPCAVLPPADVGVSSDTSYPPRPNTRTGGISGIGAYRNFPQQRHLPGSHANYDRKSCTMPATCGSIFRPELNPQILFIGPAFPITSPPIVTLQYQIPFPAHHAVL